MRPPASDAAPADSGIGGDPSRHANSTFLGTLHDLVLTLFSASEFRGWIHLHTSEIEALLPGDKASHSEVVAAALAALERRGLLNAEFFALLQIARPLRANEIAAVSERFGRTSEQATLAPRHARMRSPSSPFLRVPASSDVHEQILASWLHLSDINLDGATQDASARSSVRILSHVVDDAAALVRERIAPRPAVVFITGNSRSSQERGANPRLQEREEQWLHELLTSLDVSRDQTFLVPGVRDVDGATERHVRRLLYALRTHGERLDDVLREPDDVKLLCARAARYLAFTRSYCGDRTPFRSGLWWSHRVELAHRLTLRICGFNTTLLATGEDDRGKLQIGESQLADLLTPAPASHEILLVLSHHPPSAEWLADHATVRERLAHDATIYLHDANYGLATGLQPDADASAPRIAAGAIHAGAEPATVEYGYNYCAIVILRSGRIVLRVWPRRWSHEHAHFISGVTRSDAQGHLDVPLPERLRIARPPPATGLQPDDTLKGRYRLVELIGQGGQGKVWRAIDTRSNDEIVAVKVLNNTGGLAGLGKREAFFGGARKMKSLQHPAIIRIRAHHQCTGKAEDPYDFYVMDLVDGSDLGRAFEGRPCSDEQTIDMLVGISEAIAAAHDRGIIHRDLKPSNILRDARGQIIIVDFDSLKDLSELTSTLSVGKLISPKYCSPEQLASTDPDTTDVQVDKRTDIYSLGVIGIFLKLGQDPKPKYINRMHACIQDLTCAPALRDLLARACAFAPADRYASIHDMIAALHQVRAQLAAPAPAPDPPPLAVEVIPTPSPAPEPPVPPIIEPLDPLPLDPPPAPIPAQIDAITTPERFSTLISVAPPQRKGRLRWTWIGVAVLCAVIVLLYAGSRGDEPQPLLAVTSDPTIAADAKPEIKEVTKTDEKAALKTDAKEEPKPETVVDAKADAKAGANEDKPSDVKAGPKAREKPPAGPPANKLRAPWLERKIQAKSRSAANWDLIQIKSPSGGFYPLRFNDGGCAFNGLLQANENGDPGLLEIKKCEWDNTPRQPSSDYIKWSIPPTLLPIKCETRDRITTCTVRYKGSKTVLTIAGNKFPSSYDELIIMRLQE